MWIKTECRINGRTLSLELNVKDLRQICAALEPQQEFTLKEVMARWNCTAPTVRKRVKKNANGKYSREDVEACERTHAIRNK